MPHFSKANAPSIASYKWCGENRGEFGAKRQAAAQAMFDKHDAEQRRNGPPPRGREAR